jgi:hypothetical protein
MSLLNSKFDILRGWPNSSAVAEDWNVPTIGEGHDPLYSGTWVKLDPGVAAVPTVYSQTKASKDSTTIGTHPTLWALVIEGQDEYSSRFSNKVTVLLGGGYVVRLYNDGVAANAQFTADNLAPGVPVKLVDGKIAFLGSAGATLDADAPADGVQLDELLTAVHKIGYCLRVGEDNTCDIFVV